MNRIEFLANIDKYKGEDHSTFLEHYGILGQKWGQRRWQNADGTFNQAGKERYFGQKINNTSSEEKIGGYAADHFHKNIYLKTDKNTLKKIKKYPDIYDTEGLTDDEILKAVRRVPKIPNARAYGREVREELYNTQLNKTRSKYYETNTKDIPEAEDVEEQKIGSNPDKKEAKRLEKEAKKLEKEFTTTSKYDSSYKYLDGEKIDKWLDKEENKAVEKAYADAMETAFGETSKELHELFKDYDDNPDKYVAKAAICDSLDWYNNLGDISSEVRWFMGDDGDQGDRNSHAYYLNTKGYDEKQIDKKFWEANEKLNEGYEAGKKLSQYYNPVIPHMSEKLQKELYNRINYRWEKSDNYSYNKLLEASEGGKFNKDHMKIADDFEKKLKPSCSDKNGDGWWYFNQAVRNLDMDGLDYKDMTQADWDKINTEINKLKK